MVRVVHVVVETPSTVTIRQFLKSRADQRVVPLPPVLTESLMIHRNSLVAHDGDLVFPSQPGDRCDATASGDVSGCRHLSGSERSAGSKRPT